MVILGSVKEKVVGDDIVQSVGKDAAVNLCGATNLLEAAAWIKQATLFISNDSGLMHMAAALSKPQLAIFGPTDPARNGPYGKSFVVLRDARAVTSYKRKQETDPGMRAIPPEMVFEALEDRIAGRSRCADYSP